MASPGAMRDRYTFQRHVGSSVVGGIDRGAAWGGDVTVWAQTQFLHGSEAVQQSRLQGKQPVILTIRASSQTLPIDNAWRALNARDPSQVFNITGVEITPDRAFIQILATTQKGQANGG